MSTPAAESAKAFEEPVRGGYPDPRIIALPGRERLESWQRHAAKMPPPPIARLTGSRPSNFGDGTAEALMPASEWLATGAGVIPGGMLAILADIAFGCSFETKLPAGVFYTTAELSLTFLRPAHPGTELSAGGQAIHAGRSVGLSEAFVFDEADERLLAHGTSRLSVFPPVDPLPEPPDFAELAEIDLADRASDPYLRPYPGEPIAPEVFAESSGMEVLAMWVAGELPPPPHYYLFGVEPVSFEEGKATFRLPLTEWLVSPTRTVQGGVTAMFADLAMLAAVQTTVPAGTAFAAVDLKVNYLRPLRPDGRDAIAHAEVVHRGRSLAVTRATVLDPDGKTAALATGSSMFLPGRDAALRGDVELDAGKEDT